MIQEVLRLCPDLQPRPLAGLEILENPQIRVKVGWSVECRQHCWTVLTNNRGRSEAATIDKLVRSQIRLRIAGHKRVELNAGGSQNRLVVYGNTVCSTWIDDVLRTRKNRTVEIHGKFIATKVAGQVGSGLELRNARELPAVDRAPR